METDSSKNATLFKRTFLCRRYDSRQENMACLCFCARRIVNVESRSFGVRAPLSDDREEEGT